MEITLFGLGWIDFVLFCFCSALLSLHFYTAQNYLPQVVPCTMAWALLKKKKIISQENAPQTCPQANLNWRSLFPDDSNF